MRLIRLIRSKEISNNIVFDDNTDFLKRKDFGNSLTNLILNSKNDSFILNIIFKKTPHFCKKIT